LTDTSPTSTRRRTRRVALAAALLAGLALTVATTSASAAPTTAAVSGTPARPFTADTGPAGGVFLRTVYICDGAGQGYCKSLQPNAPTYPFEPVVVVGRNNGAWRWDVYDMGPVTDSTFTYAPLRNQLQGQRILVFDLHAHPEYCNGNSGGGDVIKTPCTDPSPSDKWVLDPTNSYLVNVGRSNDKNNWEVLCNPGGGGQLRIDTRDSCTTYHKQWGFV
jgi:hypothetical protein